ncbi:MAG: alpha/beta hydrolase, partial [Sciscionella sp.]|nr:alpha/beta hydrolase [Sciscionella sp.]
MASSAKELLGRLSLPGPHDVLRGDLALVGLPGVVCTPRHGLGLPAVAFGHGYLQPAQRYHWLLWHLASWGIVAAAPDTQRGPLPSHRLYAADLRTTLEICTKVRLGDGEISVDPARLGVAGHGMGGSAAVLAASTDTTAGTDAGTETGTDGPRVRAVGTLALAESRPSAVTAATTCTQ